MLVLLMTLTGCDRDGREYVPEPNAKFPGIKTLGELNVMGNDLDDDGTPDEYSSVTEGTLFDTLGPPPLGEFGGATGTFVGNGNVICVIVDPEAVFWNQSVAASGTDKVTYWPENVADDGDADIEVGLSAYYTGSPGVEMGSFEQVYEDSLGNEITVEYNECVMADRYGFTGSHSGRSTIEFCEIDTALHPDREYTVVVNTWSLPLDDDLLSYGLTLVDLGPGAVNDDCAKFIDDRSFKGNRECFITNEANDEEFAAFEEVFCLEVQSWWCDCTFEPGPDNDACFKLEDKKDWTIDYGAGTATTKEGTVLSLDHPSQCGDYDPNAFKTDEDLEQEEEEATL